MEWIKYHEAEKVFDLRTEHSTYQMQVREYDTLVHLYYGSPVGDALITDRIVCVDRGFSGNPYEAEKDRTFSLDTHRNILHMEMVIIVSMAWRQSSQTAVILQI